jgi:hypothetical protein
VAAIEVEYVPALQLTQMRPPLDDHVPATQLVHVVAPALAPDHVPAAQLVQVETEVAAIPTDHVPILQATHVLMLAPIADDHDPALQLLHEVEPLLFSHVPFGHNVQAAVDVAPFAIEKVPALQSVHES